MAKKKGTHWSRFGVAYGIIVGVIFLLAFGGYLIYQVPPPSPKIEEKAPLPEVKAPEIKRITYRYDVTPIWRDYPSVVHQAFEEAKESIYMIMFVVNPQDLGENHSHPVNSLIEDLIEARKRGVEVHVLLDNSITVKGFSYEIHKEVIDYLTERGVDAQFATKNKKTHDKLIIIDDRIVIVGAHNWTVSSFFKNVEASVKIEISPPDPEIKRYFSMKVIEAKRG